MGLLGRVTFNQLARKALRDFVKMVNAPQVAGMYSFGISSLGCKGVFVMHLINASETGATCQWTLFFFFLLVCHKTAAHHST